MNLESRAVVAEDIGRQVRGLSAFLPAFALAASPAAPPRRRAEAEARPTPRGPDQILTYGERKSTASFVSDVNALTVADLAATATKMLKSPLTLVATGDLRSLPRYTELAKRF